MESTAQNTAMGVSVSRFYMWRAVVAMAHADDILALEELNYLSDCFKEEDFSYGQMEIIKRDLSKPQNMERMFLQISDAKDRRDFFKFAQGVAESDGNFCRKERDRLNKMRAICAGAA